MNCTVVLRVKELKLCVSFYRDILQLGEPEFVSSFGSGFTINDSAKLFLLLDRARYLEHASSATSWCFETSDLAGLEERLNTAGYPLEKELFQLGCLEFRRGADPEGNIFYVRQETQNL